MGTNTGNEDHERWNYQHFVERVRDDLARDPTIYWVGAHRRAPRIP